MVDFNFTSNNFQLIRLFHFIENMMILLLIVSRCHSIGKINKNRSEIDVSTYFPT